MNMDKALLEELYWERRMSQNEIGKLLSKPRSTIQLNMNKFNIPKRNRSEANKGNIRCAWNRGLNKYIDPRVRKQSEKLKGRRVSQNTEFKKGMIPFHKGKTAIEDSRIPHGETHGMWNNNSTLKNYGKNGVRLSQSHKEKQWRKIIYERDNYTCQVCHDRSKKYHPVILNAHHIKSWSKYPESRFDINNGITLCRECHLKIHSSEGIRLDIEE